MKGFLRSPDGTLYQLAPAPKMTTIGREGCDLIVQSVSVEIQHAVIEQSEQEGCFVLQDLNSAQGTYVNDCRVQNAAVRLAPGDIIRFGYNGQPYELQIDIPQMVSCPPISQSRPSWTQPITVIPDRVADYQQSAGISQSSYRGQNASSAWVPVSQPPMPHPPPSMRSRPLSAGSAGVRRPGPATPTGVAPRSVTGAWVNTGTTRSHSQGNSPTTEIILLQEKEQKILQLNQEINRLASYENEASRKDEMITQLKEELNRTRRLVETSTDGALASRVNQLQGEIDAKTAELKKQAHIISESTDNPASLRIALNEHVQANTDIRSELEKTRKDKSITSGLVTQMQRDMSNKDATISRLTREIENLKKELKEKDVQLAAVNAKFTRLKDNKKADEERDANVKELVALRSKFMSAENKLQEASENVKALKEELEKMKNDQDAEAQNYKKLQAELDNSKSQLTNLQRTERTVRVDMEQTSRRLERFRNRIIQVTFSTPGVKAPDDEVSDDELVTMLKKVIDERTELHRHNLDMKDAVKLTNASKKEITDKLNKIKHSLLESQKRLKSNGRLSSHLKQEISLLQSVQTEENVAFIRDVAVTMLQHELEWQQETEDALEKCGINVKLSSENPAKHIINLFTKLDASSGSMDKLQKELASLKVDHQQELEAHTARLRQEMEDRIKDAIEKTKLEGEEKLNQAIDDIRSVEDEKREGVVAAEKSRIAELEASLEQLQASITERQEDDSSNRETTMEAIRQVEEYKHLEVELREKIAELETAKAKAAEEFASEKGALECKADEDMGSFKEQIRQHSVTICAMEERLNKVMKKNKDYQAEISELKQKIAEKPVSPPPKKKPELAPKPKVILQKNTEELAAMEQVIQVLRRENIDLKKQLQDQADVIVGLRRDLAGASARLSDMRGELTEAQKEEIENNRSKVGHLQGEMLELRQQLAKLSQIVDKQSEELKGKDSEIGKFKAALNKFKNVANEKENKIKDLEGRLVMSEEDSKKQCDLLDKEGRITSELTAIGAQCRGERHEQVIGRQREALAELRGRIKALEQSRPPIPNKDQALQQVVMLKKELAELRAQQALADSHNGDLGGSSSLEKEVNRARGIVTIQSAEADVEKSAHRETLDTLEESERSYLTLLRAIASCLELEECRGLRSMAHIPKDERDRLGSEREQMCELMSSRIKTLKERLSRKEELLQGYEQGLSKLRQAEELTVKRQQQVETLVSDVRGKAEETQYLRESLARTRNQLDQEKRLNNAIKQKKTFHLEQNEKKQYPKHACPPEDIFGKNSARRRAEKEKMKRKNYEIKTLKNQLGGREQELCKQTARLVNLETSLGIPLDDEEVMA
ncbi:forkhead-associated domain-containing protein 1-like [Lineus longissimus]|uniref:forkhead-associated domain-containing protein 1-like n=1 Tax=Lineus longissimus TaxID=88925 RepID=UPI002B4D8E14